MKKKNNMDTQTQKDLEQERTTLKYQLSDRLSPLLWSKVERLVDIELLLKE